MSVPIVDRLVDVIETAAAWGFALLLPLGRAQRLASRVASLARFGFVGGVSIGLNLGLTALLHEVVDVPPAAAYAVALTVVTLVNFMLCRYWIFPASSGSVIGQGLGFVALAIAFRTSEFCMFVIAHHVFCFHYLMTAVLVAVVSFFVKHEVYRRVLFSSGMNVAESK